MDTQISTHSRCARKETIDEHIQPARHLQVKLIDNDTQWQAIAAQWDHLHFLTDSATPSQSYAYLHAWWAHFAGSSRLFIVTVYEADQLIALAPLQIQQEKYAGHTQRWLNYIGDSLELDRPVFLGSADSVVIDAIIQFLLTRCEDWDCMFAYEQNINSSLLCRLASALGQAGYLVKSVPGSQCPYLTVKGTWDDYLASRSRSLRKQLGRHLRKIRSDGDVHFSVVDAWPDVRTGLANYLQVEECSWKFAANIGLRRTKEHHCFYESIVERLGPQGEVQFRFLEFNEKLIAATFGIMKNNRFAALHIAHDSRFDAYSPGFIITAMELEDMFHRQQDIEYDFLGGSEQHKTSWSTAIRETCDFYAFSPTPRLTIHYYWIFKIKPPLKLLLRRIGVFDPLLKFAIRIKLVKSK